MLLAAMLGLGAWATSPALADGPLHAVLVVDDGPFFYDADGDCAGDTDDPTGGVALRSWDVSLPLLGPGPEPGGHGCLGGPRSWNVSIGPGHEVLVTGTLRFTHDANAGWGGANDAHLHVFDAAGQFVTSTLTAVGPGFSGPGPQDQGSHPIGFQMPFGDYRFEEDAFNGAHTSWLSNFTVWAADIGGP